MKKIRHKNADNILVLSLQTLFQSSSSKKPLSFVLWGSSGKLKTFCKTVHSWLQP